MKTWTRFDVAVGALIAALGVLLTGSLVALCLTCLFLGCVVGMWLVERRVEDIGCMNAQPNLGGTSHES